MVVVFSNWDARCVELHRQPGQGLDSNRGQHVRRPASGHHARHGRGRYAKAVSVYSYLYLDRLLGGRSFSYSST